MLAFAGAAPSATVRELAELSRARLPASALETRSLARRQVTQRDSRDLPPPRAALREMLELSIFELRNTLTELEKRLGSVEDEGNEWKTRYETQVELNRQLERQTGLLQEKMEHIRGNPTDRLSSIRSFDQMPVGSLNQLLKQLEEEKRNLQNQLKDYELRLEQEAKAYHKANDERRMYLAEISQTSATLKIAERQKTDAVQIKRENQILRRRHNVPENQRILDPKKGPIKKTAGVKQLPKLKR
ncbi:coiled-coil domain-containing protein 169 isoform X2 [Natator depressus]|uniref:coiled-coil domain-containing protein 169 isoform X2 n=1 Tax=Natator depressus TaxID=27790 RepID=UPI003EBA05C2